MSLYLTDYKSTLVQVMAWCPQATSHYLHQCWPRSMSHMVSLGHNELKQMKYNFSNLNSFIAEKVFQPIYCQDAAIMYDVLVSFKMKVMLHYTSSKQYNIFFFKLLEYLSLTYCSKVAIAIISSFPITSNIGIKHMMHVVISTQNFYVLLSILHYDSLKISHRRGHTSLCMIVD